MNTRPFVAGRRRLLALLGTGLLVACATPTAPPQAYPTDWPQQWAHPYPSTPTPWTDAWWTRFGDALLNAHVARALAQHPDPRIALLRARTAVLRAEASAAALRPTPTGSLSTSVGRPLQGEAPSTRSAGSSWSLGWEIDLWGRLRIARDMAGLEVEASRDDIAAAQALLVAQVVRQHWQLIALEQRLTAQRSNLAQAQRVFQLIQIQHDAGAISGLDLTQASQALQQQQQTLAQLHQQREEQRLAFALLLDLPPAQLPSALVPTEWPADALTAIRVPDALPADVLLRRPDLRAAERRLRATALNVEAVRRSFWPGLSLTAGINTGSSALRSILANPAASLGAGLSLPFLNWGEMRRNPRIAAHEHEAATLQFRQSMLRALVDVETGLSQLQHAQSTLARQRELVAQTRRIARLTEVRYRAGATALRPWLDAQELERQAELALVDAQLAVVLAQVAVVQAVGWQPPGAGLPDPAGGVTSASPSALAAP